MFTGNLNGTMWKLPDSYDSLILSTALAGKYKIQHDVILPSGYKYRNREFLFVQYNSTSTLGKYLHSYVMGTSGNPAGAVSITPGSIVIFKGNYALDSSSGTDITQKLKSWLNSYATQIEPIRVSCSIDYDDEWIQKDCHWQYDRLFNLTFDIWHGNLIDQVTGQVIPGADYSTIGNDTLGYHFGTLQSAVDENLYEHFWENVTCSTYTKSYNGLVNRALTRYTITLRLSNLISLLGLGEVLAQRTDEGFITITAFANIIDTKYLSYTSSATFDYLLEMPPATVTPNVTQVVDHANMLCCSWDPAKLLEASSGLDCPAIDEVNGYCIEFFHKAAEAKADEPFKQIKGLTWNIEEFGLGNWKSVVRKKQGYIEPEVVDSPPIYELSTSLDYKGKILVFDTNFDVTSIGKSEYFIIASPSEGSEYEHYYIRTRGNKLVLSGYTGTGDEILHTIASLEPVEWYTPEFKLPNDFETASWVVMTDKYKSFIKVKEDFSTCTYIGQGTSGEILIDCKQDTQVYFNPKELGINPGDSYLIRVYPYNAYSSYIDDYGYPQPSSLLTNEGAIWDGKTSKGIVRVKTDKGWVEGQVFVLTNAGWKQAEGIYTKTTEGWKEAK